MSLLCLDWNVDLETSNGILAKFEKETLENAKKTDKIQSENRQLRQKLSKESDQSQEQMHKHRGRK